MGAKERVVAFLKAITEQNNVKLGKRKAGLLSATFSQQDDILLDSRVSPGLPEVFHSSCRFTWNA